MGLSDILTGMMNGPRGERQPSSGGSGGGMSPIMMALLGLLAYKAFKGRRAQGPNQIIEPRNRAGLVTEAGDMGSFELASFSVTPKVREADLGLAISLSVDMAHSAFVVGQIRSE